MSPVPAIDPKISIKDLIKAEWIDSNIVGTITPDFHTGWWNPSSLSAQVTFTGKNEDYEGVSGYGAIAGDGSGPVQIANGVLFANCWAYRDEGAGGPNPKQVVYDMAEEVRRIVKDKFNAVTDLMFISVTSVSDVPPDPNKDPLLFRTSVALGFKWTST